METFLVNLKDWNFTDGTPMSVFSCETLWIYSEQLLNEHLQVAGPEWSFSFPFFKNFKLKVHG